MSLLDQYIESYKKLSFSVEYKYDDNILGLVEKSTALLLDEELLPSLELEEAMKQLHVRAKEPMKVAITGQFSSGKSTFLNALLSKNILPTGITPVTSKVNYIRYGNEFRIQVHYKDGRDEYQQIEDIARFTDQRCAVEEIEYLTLYAPLEMLREITFVDTPGLNSQDDTDTITTQRVLKDVDGIIWLSLIDNAGKMSEAQTLSQYMEQYQNKSLCVLNQKDKFEPEQVEQSVSYVKQSFSKYFSEVVPISAIEALLSRSRDKNVIAEEGLDNFLMQISEKLKSEQELDIGKMYQSYKDTVSEAHNSNFVENIKLLKSSNIETVLEFIETQIRPASHSSKAFSITKDIRQTCELIIKQHQFFISIYDEISVELNLFEEEAQKKLTQLKDKFGKALQDAYRKIEDIIEVIADDIYKHITHAIHIRYIEKKSGLFRKNILYEPIEYKGAKIESDKIYKHLFYEDDIVGKMFKIYVKNLKTIQDEVNQHNAEVYKILEDRIQKWQNRYEIIRKHDPLHSNMEFANIRKFASKAYEYMLKPFSDQIHASYAKISSEFNHLSSAVSFNYQNATQVSIAFLEQKIGQSVALYESDPERFSLYTPKLDEIKDRLNSSFHIYELQNMMNTKKTFLSKNYDTLLREFKCIKQDREIFLQSKKARHEKIIKMLQVYIKDIEIDI